MQSQSVKGQAVSGQLLIAASGQIPHNRHKCSGTQLNEPDQLRKIKVNLSVVGEGKEIAGWASGLVGLVAIVSTILELIH